MPQELGGNYHGMRLDRETIERAICEYSSCNAQRGERSPCGHWKKRAYVNSAFLLFLNVADQKYAWQKQKERKQGERTPVERRIDQRADQGSYHTREWGERQPAIHPITAFAEVAWLGQKTVALIDTNILHVVLYITT